MEFLSREQVISDLQQPLSTYINQFALDDIGIFEEEGQDDSYYIGYTVKKADKVLHIHTPFRKNKSGGLTPISNEWTVESDDPNGEDSQGYQDLESVLRKM